MPSLSLSLRPQRPVSTSREAPEFLLLLGNFNDDDISTPRDWCAGTAVEIVGPGSWNSLVKPFGEAAAARPLDDAIFGLSERAKPFTLSGDLPPGQYHLTATVPLDPPLVAKSEWFLEAPVIAPVLVVDDLAWALLPGVRQSTLLRSRLAFADVSSAEPVSLAWPERMAVGPPSGRSLAVSSDSRRLAWLRGDGAAVFAATTVAFDSIPFSLPGPAARILSPILCDDDGVSHFAVLAEGQSTVWVFRAAAPAVRDTEAAGRNENDENDEDDEDDDIFVPSAEVFAPSLLATIPLPFPSSHVAFAGLGSELRLVSAVPATDGVRLAIARIDPAGSPATWNTVHVDRASLIDNCDPWVRPGEAYFSVSILLRTGGPADSHLAIANFAFDSALRPVWLDGVGLLRLTPGDPVSAALSLDAHHYWPNAWAAISLDNRLTGGFLRPGANVHSRPAPTPSPGSFSLLASTEDLVVASDYEDGELRFQRL